jgi:hypothetical protein
MAKFLDRYNVKRWSLMNSVGKLFDDGDDLRKMRTKSRDSDQKWNEKANPGWAVDSQMENFCLTSHRDVHFGAQWRIFQRPDCPNCEELRPLPNEASPPFETVRRRVTSFCSFNVIGGSDVAMTGDNVGDLVQLCGEFEFKAFAAKVDHWRTRGENFDC